MTLLELSYKIHEFIAIHGGDMEVTSPTDAEISDGRPQEESTGVSLCLLNCSGRPRVYFRIHPYHGNVLPDKMECSCGGCRP